MKVILNDGNEYMLRFDRGEEVVMALKQFCQREKIDAGFFHGLGACSYLRLAFYHLETKKYSEKEFTQDLEIANITGDIALFEGDLIVHMHGTFSDENMAAFGGHVMAMKIGGACEILLTKFSQPMTRKPDAVTGLKLLE